MTNNNRGLAFLLGHITKLLIYVVFSIPIAFLYAANLRATCNVDSAYLVILSVIFLVFVKKTLKTSVQFFSVVPLLLTCACLLLNGLDKNKGYGYDASLFEIALYILCLLSFMCLLFRKRGHLWAVLFSFFMYCQFSYQVLNLPADAVRQVIGRQLIISPSRPLYFTKIQSRDVYAIVVENNPVVTETLHYQKNAQGRYILLDTNFHQEGNEKIGGQYIVRTAIFSMLY